MEEPLRAGPDRRRGEVRVAAELEPVGPVGIARGVVDHVPAPGVTAVACDLDDRVRPRRGQPGQQYGEDNGYDRFHRGLHN